MDFETVIEQPAKSGSGLTHDGSEYLSLAQHQCSPVTCCRIPDQGASFDTSRLGASLKQNKLYFPIGVC